MNGVMLRNSLRSIPLAYVVNAVNGRYMTARRKSVEGLNQRKTSGQRVVKVGFGCEGGTVLSNG